MITLSNLRPNPGAKRRARRLGRGPGSGRGKTAGRGHKGQRSRAGKGVKPWFEGGQMPLYRRLPKRGFKNPFRVEYQVVNLDGLAQRFKEGETADPESMRARGLIRRKLPVKVLARGSPPFALTVRAHAFSKKARELIEAAGGRVQVIER